jgi:hypothetical protein
MNATILMTMMTLAINSSASSIQWAGSFGNVSVVRQNQNDQPAAGTVLAESFQVSTGSQSGAVLFQQSASCVQIGPQSDVEIQATTEPLMITVLTGEIRTVATGRRSVALQTSLAITDVANGIVRVRADSDRVLFFVEQGTITLLLTDAAKVAADDSAVRKVGFDENDQENSLVLNAGQQVEIRTGSGFSQVTEENTTDWQIDSDLWLVSISQNRSSSSTQNQSSEQSQTQNNPPDTAQSGNEASESTQAQNTQTTSSGLSSNLTLGPTLASTGFSGAAFSPSDANQDTAAGKLTTPFRGLFQNSAFPGVVHIVTGETKYIFDSVQLQSGDGYLSGTTTPEYWSIGEGTPPLNSQIVTSLGTGTSINPEVLAIPRFESFYLVQLDQYPLNDALGGNTTGNPQLAVTGLVGQTPTGPSIQGGTPYLDSRAQINPQATFALGEFAVRQSGNNPQIAMRRSDQDRRIIKDSDGNDLNDQVTPNSDVTGFAKVPDNRFLPQNPDVYVPVTDPASLGGQSPLRNVPTFSNSNQLRRAAFTALTAKELAGYSQRTGQTRFVVDGRIIDISGYRP